jgi:hypothetical protein
VQIASAKLRFYRFWDGDLVLLGSIADHDELADLANFRRTSGRPSA